MSTLAIAKKKRNTFNNIINDIKKNYILHLIILVPVIYMIIFHYGPMYGVQIAFKNYTGVQTIANTPWADPLFKYYIKLFKSPIFKNILINTLVLSLYSLVAGFPIPIILALALNSTRSRMFRKTTQMITYAPYFISIVVLIGMMYQFFGPKYGIVNIARKALGMDVIMYMGEGSYFRTMFVFSGVWQHAGWSSIIYLSALASIDPGLHEAALVDGANRFQRMIHIDIPGIMPTMITLLILSTGRIMTLGFQKVLLMQNATNLQFSQIIQTYVYKVGLASSIPQYSYATAIGLFNSLINFALIIVVNQISKKVTETSLW